jgi:CHASE3 domain sensor protein
MEAERRRMLEAEQAERERVAQAAEAKVTRRDTAIITVLVVAIPIAIGMWLAFHSP